MSSHHIIRENQEPALLIIDRDALSEELLGQLLEWSPILIVTGEAYDFFRSRSIKVDAVVAKQDSIQSVDEELIDVLFYESESEFLPTVTMYLRQRGQSNLYMLWNNFPQDISLELQELKTVVLFGNNVRYVYISNFEKWLPEGFQLIFDKNEVDFSGLTEVGKHVFEVVSDGFIQVNSKSQQRVLIGEIL